jgi:flagellar assembly protein FliH
LGQFGAGRGNHASARIELFEYPVCLDAPVPIAWNGWADEDKSVSSGPAEAGGDGLCRSGEAAAAAFEQRLAEETRRFFEAGRERGRQEGQQAEREMQTAARAAAEEQRVRQAADLIGTFARERDRYMHSVEQEVVKLALAVAARILRREAQMDPLLLTGAVRVALGQLSDSTEVRLRVPAGDLELWSRTMALLPHLQVKPIVAAGDGMRLGDCIIETALGSVDLGIRSQLAEIERGFFDRAGGGRPEASVLLQEMPETAAEIRP